MGALESKGVKAGLKNKLIWTMLVVGALPLILAMILSCFQGTKSLQGVIGASFKALAYETSTKIDLLIQGEIIAHDRLSSNNVIQNSILKSNQKLRFLDSLQKERVLAQEKRDWENPKANTNSLYNQNSSKVFKQFLKRKAHSALVTRALFVTDSFGVLRGSIDAFPEFITEGNPATEKRLNGEKGTVFIRSIYSHPKSETPLVQFAFPILGELGRRINPLGFYIIFLMPKNYFQDLLNPLPSGIQVMS